MPADAFILSEIENQAEEKTENWCPCCPSARRFSSQNFPRPTVDSSAPGDPVAGLVLTQLSVSLLGSLIHPLRRSLRLLDGRLKGNGRAKRWAFRWRLSFKMKGRRWGKNQKKAWTAGVGGGRDRLMVRVIEKETEPHTDNVRAGWWK